MNKIANYLKETKVEMGHVKWPTKKQAIGFTVAVVVVSVLVAYYLGLLDYVFKTGLGILLNK